MIHVIPREGVNVRDPRLAATHGSAFIYIRKPIMVEDSDPIGQQLLRHVRAPRCELLPGNEYTAQLAGVPFEAPRKGHIK